MVNNSPALLNATFSALADPTRRAILEQLALGESSVTQLANPFDMSLPAISKHLRILERAGLLSREKTGRTHRCSLVANPLKEAADWIIRYRRFWETKLDALAHYLDESQKEKVSWPATPHIPTLSSTSKEPSPRPARKSGTRGRTRKH